MITLNNNVASAHNLCRWLSGSSKISRDMPSHFQSSHKKRKNRCRASAAQHHARILHGFTLIELLVVIAIIALLVSILLPSLKTAKELAEATHCKSTLKNLGLAFSMYQNDYEILPPRWIGRGVDVAGCQYTGPAQLLKPYTDTPEYLSTPAIGLNNMNPWRCVSKDRPHAYSIGLVYYQGAWRKDWGYTDYTYYGMLGDNMPSSIPNPSNTILLTESQRDLLSAYRMNWCFNYLMGAERDFCLYTGGVDEDGKLTCATLELRHNEGTNIHFADGHVGWQDEITLDMLPFSSR